MTSDEAESTLRSMLTAAGVDIAAVSTDDIDGVWAVYRTFAAVPVTDADPADQDGDMLLAQWGCHPVFENDDSLDPVGERFYLDVTRQFSFRDEHGEYDRMVQLQCEFSLPATTGLKALGDHSFWADGDLDAFFARAKATSGYSTLRAVRSQPLQLGISYSDV